jgi:hypothetical protein
MSLLLAALFAAPLLVHFSPDRVGIRYAQTSPSGSVSGAGTARAAAESVPRPTGWRSSPGATMAQCACGCGAVAVPVGIGVALGFGSFLYENYGRAYLPLAATGILLPAGAALGVASAGCGRGRTGRAYLYAYTGALLLGGLGYAVGATGGNDLSGAYIGWASGSMVGSLVGYNLREIP